MKVYENKEMTFPKPGQGVRETAKKAADNDCCKEIKVSKGILEAFHSFMIKR